MDVEAFISNKQELGTLKAQQDFAGRCKKLDELILVQIPQEAKQQRRSTSVSIQLDGHLLITETHICLMVLSRRCRCLTQ